MHRYYVESLTGELLGESNEFGSAHLIAEWYRASGVRCTVRKR